MNADQVQRNLHIARMYVFLLKLLYQKVPRDVSANVDKPSCPDYTDKLVSLIEMASSKNLYLFVPWRMKRTTRRPRPSSAKRAG